MKQKKSRKTRVSGKKKRCDECGHAHKRMSKTGSWMCMKRGCKCDGLYISGRKV